MFSVRWFIPFFFLSTLVHLHGAALPEDLQPRDQLVILYAGGKFSGRTDEYTNRGMDRELVAYTGTFESTRGAYTGFEGGFLVRTADIKESLMAPRASRQYSIAEISKFILKGEALAKTYGQFAVDLTSIIQKWRDEKTHLDQGDFKVDQKWIPKSVTSAASNIIEANRKLGKEDPGTFLSTIVTQWKTLTDRRPELPAKLYDAAQASIERRVEYAFKNHLYSQAALKIALKEARIEKKRSEEFVELFSVGGKHASLNRIIVIVSEKDPSPETLKQIEGLDWLDEGLRTRLRNSCTELLKRMEELKSKVGSLQQEVKDFNATVKSLNNP
jgi:hypothetical protein